MVAHAQALAIMIAATLAPSTTSRPIISAERQVCSDSCRVPAAPAGPECAKDWDRGEPRGAAPPTPPYVRVRIRRFEKNANALRSNDSTRVGWAFGFMHHRERF